MKELWQKHHRLLKFTIFLMIIIILYGAILIISSIQEAIREKSSTGFTVESMTGDIPAYNVEGMTEEEVQQFIEYLRNQEDR